MLDIAIVASGSRGDVQPYIALGRGLKEAGYTIRILTSENFESLVTESGLAFCSTGASVEALLENDEWRKTIASGNFITILGKMQSEVKKQATEIARRMPPLLKDADLIITGMSGLGGVIAIGEKLNIPVIQAYVVPFTPTSDYPSPLVPKLPFGSILNKLSFHVTRQMLWQTTRAGDTAIRKLLTMPKGSFWGPFRSLLQHKAPTMYGFSRHVIHRPNDWPEQHEVTGYWYLSEPDGWTPPVDLVAFLNAGPAPVYIGFGSMRGGDAEEAGRIALEALARSGQRGVLASGWGGIKASDVPDTVHLISSMPHRWLFPRMVAVVHHGGAGTTAAGLGAGVPSIIVPFMGDQPFWGQRVMDMGVGPAPIPRKQLNGKRLGDAIAQAVTDASMRDRARELGQKIQAEDGIANAVAFVERYSKPPVTVHRPLPVLA